jgi:TPR repeat protein
MNNLPKKPETETETETKVAIKSKKYSIKQHQLYLMIFLVVILSLFGLSAFASPSTEWKKEGDDPWVGGLSHESDALLAFFMFEDCSVDLDIHLQAPISFSDLYEEGQTIKASIDLIVEDKNHQLDDEATIEELTLDDEHSSVILNFGTFTHVRNILRTFDPSKMHLSFSIDQGATKEATSYWDFASFEEPISELAASCKQFETTDILDEGLRFYWGEDRRKSYDIAFNLLQEAANRGNIRGMASLGTLYENGEGVKKDLEIAVIWYRQAAKHGDPYAQFNLGKFYTNGTFVNRNLDKAEDLLTHALNAGVEEATKELQEVKDQRLLDPYMYTEFTVDGLDSLKSIIGDLHSEKKSKQKLALKHLEELAKRGDGDGYFVLAKEFTSRDWIFGHEQKARRSIQHAQRIAWAQFNTDLLFKIAELYETGEIVPKSTKRAISLYERAARFSDPKANLKLGNLILDEAKNIADLDRAFEAFWLAAREQSSQANRCLSLFYAFGLAVEPDAEEAVRYSKLASTEENPQNFVCSFERIKELSIQIS